jgi:uncharacterized protein (TIGR02172 family)
MKKIGQGREAELFAWEDGKVLRLYRDRFPREKAEFQVRVLEAVRAAGVRVPHVFETVEVDERFGVVLERIDGTDLLAMLGKKPWRIRWVGSIAGRAQAEINSAKAPDRMPLLNRRYATIFERITAIPKNYAEAALARLEELPDGDRLLHGDFHPGNIMMHGEQPVIIDWTNVARGSPEADLARTRMLMELAEPPKGTPVIVRAIALFARSILRDAHMHAYRSACPFDEEILQRWELPVAVVKLAEGFKAERKKLVPYIEARLAR